jgi:hypothetical protein
VLRNSLAYQTFSPKKGFIGFAPFHANKENKTGNFFNMGLILQNFYCAN